MDFYFYLIPNSSLYIPQPIQFQQNISTYCNNRVNYSFTQKIIQKPKMFNSLIYTQVIPF